MKEASGELNLTVVTIIAIAAVAGIGTFLYGKVKATITDQWKNINETGKSETRNSANSEWSR